MYILFFLIFLIACTKAEDDTLVNKITDSEGDLKVLKQVIDPFEIILNPSYKELIEIQEIKDTEFVLVYRSESGQYYIYPHRYMLVEVVNDIIEGIPLAINFCPLTATGMAWNRIFDTDTTLLAASGILHHDNLVLWDSISDNLWSQMKLYSFSERYKEQAIKLLPIVQTNWGIAKQYFRGAKVFQHECDSICAPRSFDPENNQTTASQFGSYSPGTLVFGIHSTFGEIFEYSLDDFEMDFDIYYPNIPGASIVVIGSKEYELIVAYETEKEFDMIEGEFPIVMKDNTGTSWDVFGVAVDGPSKGQQLKPANAYFSYAWAWKQMFSNE